MKAGQFTPIQFPIGVGFRPLALSDDASTIILDTVSLNPTAFESDMVAMNLATRQITGFFSTPDSKQMAIFMAVSNDGRRVLYRIGGPQGPDGPAYIADTSSGQSTPIALPAGKLVSDGTLTGSGDAAFLVTPSGRIVKVTLASGAIDTAVPATPYARNLQQFAPGSLYRLQGTDGARLLLDGQPMPIIYSTPGELGVQVPWEQRTGDVPFLLDAPGDSPFQQSQTVTVSPIDPKFWPAEPGQLSFHGIKIIKGDWSGYVTAQPGPGEIFYIYMTGLGAVNGPVQTAAPASLTTLNPIRGTLTCDLGGVRAETLFAGLAPGTVGIYVTAFRMPADAATPQLNAFPCLLAGASGNAYFGIFNPPPHL